MNTSAPPSPWLTPAVKAALTLATAGLLCGTFLYVRLSKTIVAPHAFRPEPRESTRPPVSLQMRVETEPPGAVVTGPQGMREVAPFFFNVPPNAEVALRVSLPGYVPQDVNVQAKKAKVIRVVLQPVEAAPAP